MAEVDHAARRSGLAASLVPGSGKALTAGSSGLRSLVPGGGLYPLAPQVAGGMQVAALEDTSCILGLRT